ncbi:MAG: DNA polymerase III subunit gamma/tau [Planctomycetaceae bacterium]|nr:DNA polymerase III subunit gamma/tau [Planctomycetaceae bacterium]
MSYLVLARKYRPRRFEDVVGQEVITRVLRGAISEGRIGHAYLFSGPRGTGKTTTARIFAKALNCEQGPTGHPCGTCARCVASDAGQEFDVIEIDAASNTSVNDVRELRDQVAYAPLEARYKIYIVDEVHMLSKAAFNALLKTLEEPPPHVIFLFATTELHKVLDTILSRCQVLRLAPIREEEIANRLTAVFAAENVRAGDGLVEELARRARGGMRDALSLADQLLALAGDAPQLADLSRLAGAGGPKESEELLERLLENDRARIFDAVASYAGREAELATGLLEVVRGALVAALCGENSPLVEGGAEAGARLAALARRLGAERAELWLAELLRARERMRGLAGQERIVLESTLLDLARPESGMPLLPLVARLEALEARLSGAVVAPPVASRAPAATPPPAAPRAAPAVAPPAAPRRSAAPAAPAAPTSEADAPVEVPRPPQRPTAAAAPARAPVETAPAAVGPEVLDRAAALLRPRQPALAELLARKGRVDGIEGGTLRLGLTNLAEADRRLVEDRRNQRVIERALSDAAGQELVLELALGTPAPRQAAPEDTFTRGVADLFGGRIEEL